MKMKNLIKLICTLVIVALLCVWAFGANVTLFGKKFVGWGENMIDGNDLGKTNVFVYQITAPKDVQNFDAHAAAINAVSVFQKRAELVGYGDVNVRLLGKDMVMVDIPLSEYAMKGGTNLFTTNGKLTVTTGGATVFTEADVKSAKITGVDSTTGKYLMDVTFTKEAKAKLETLTSVGAYTLSFALDGSIGKVDYKGSDVIKNGKVTLEFASSAINDMVLVEYCLNSGSVDGTIKNTSSYMINGTAGESAKLVLGIAALVILVLAAVYFVLSKRMMGVAAALTLLIALLGIEFFAATFSWLVVNIWAVVGLAFAFMAVVIALIVVINSISKQYALGKDIIASIDNGIMNVRGMILEVGVVMIAVGIGLWLAGTDFAFFGIALIGGGIASIICALLIFKSIVKTLIAVGADNAKALGLKRGE